MQFKTTFILLRRRRWAGRAPGFFNPGLYMSQILNTEGVTIAKRTH